MPYKRSLSLKIFLSEINSILSTARNASRERSNVIESPDLDLTFNMVMRAAIFSSSAQLEEYIKTSIYDWLNSVQKYRLGVSTLPDEIRWFYIYSRHINIYKTFIYNGNEHKLIEGLKNNKINGFIDRTSIIDDSFAPSIIINDSKYPSIKNIRRLYKRIGIHDIFSQVNRTSRRNFEQIVTSFLDVRQAIAHQSPPTPLFSDVELHLKNIEDFTKALDRVLCSHVCRYHGLKCWRVE